jgi:hypothetical protein
VIAWPGSDEPGFANLQYSYHDTRSPDGKLKGKYPVSPGKPFRDPAQLCSFAGWLNGTANNKDVWFCTSLQGKTKLNKRGNVVAARSAHDALLQKSIWIDADAGPGKKYTTVEDAFKAIITFRKVAGLPRPSAIVFSGNGVHVYWISKRALSPVEWQPFASGLRNMLVANNIVDDPGLTTDIARILRMPGTFNHKSDPPKPVELAPLPLKLYDFETDLDVVKSFAGPVTQSSPQGPAQSLFADGVDPAIFRAGPDPQFKGKFTDEPGLSAGIDKFADNLVAYEPIFKGCGFYKDALKTGGAGHHQPLWNLAVLGATFMENGNAVAHAISKGHPEYTEVDTQALYDRKVAERHHRGIGYPSCATIEANGCSACATCPLRGKGKSPLNIRPEVFAAENPAAGDSSRAEPSFVDCHADFVGPNKPNPVSVLMALHAKGVGIRRLRVAMNQFFAVVKYGTQILVATIVDDEICLMKAEDFHKMLANIVVVLDDEEIPVSRLWFKWKDRRQYLGAGVVFQPGGPLEIKGDMLNLWRGFGIKPMPGNWSLLREHIFKEVCSGHQEHFDYLIRWMAYAVQHPDRPMGVAVAFLGAQGAGKGIVARTFGKFFGKHFSHIANGDQLTGRFNASIGMSCAVFLDEALWAGDRRGEGVLKALITEPSLQLEAKFRDPIRVENRLRIIVASNNDWAIPAGIGDRRWFVLYVADTYSGTAHHNYWDAVYNQIDGGGAAAMLHDLLSMDVSGFNVRAVPHTAAKALQQVHSLQGSMAWLHDILEEGAIAGERWQDAGLTIETDRTYTCYVEFSKRQRDWKPEIKSVWSKKLRTALGPHIDATRPTKGKARVRSFQFAPLDDCRRQFASHLCAPDLEWETENEPI